MHSGKVSEDYDSFVNNAEVQALGAKLSEFSKPDTHVYEVVISRSRPEGSVPQITTGGFLTHLAEFRMKPENQKPMLELAQSEIVKAMKNPGLISVNFHRSLDSVRVLNYGQWRSQADFEAILEQPGFEPKAGYWAGLADNEFHLYEVVLTEPAG